MRVAWFNCVWSTVTMFQTLPQVVHIFTSYLKGTKTHGLGALWEDCEPLLHLLHMPICHRPLWLFRSIYQTRRLLSNYSPIFLLTTERLFSPSPLLNIPTPYCKKHTSHSRGSARTRARTSTQVMFCRVCIYLYSTDFVSSVEHHTLPDTFCELCKTFIPVPIVFEFCKTFMLLTHST